LRGRTDSFDCWQLGTLRVLSRNYSRSGKHERHDAEKPMHRLLLLDGGA
jgi:hypothetical protein